MTSMRLYAVLLASVLLAGCAGVVDSGAGGGGVSAPAPEPTAPDEEPAQPEPRRPGSGAVAELIAEAERASAASDHAGAAARLERALRIEPHNPALWQNLAVVRYRQDRYAEAADLAERSNGLAGENPELKRRNWALIAEARRLQGDAAGAREARERARSLLPAGGR